MRSYILSIVSAAIICAVINTLLGNKTTAGKIVRLLGGILMTMTVISPLTKVTFANVADFLEGISVTADAYVGEGTAAANNNICGIIKSQTQAYILDKAKSMGLEIAVEVELDGDNNQIPSSVTISGTLSPYAKEVLSSYIADNLGITKEDQHWK